MNLEELIIGTLIEIYIRRDGFNYKVVSKIENISGNMIAVSPIASSTRFFRFLKDDVVDLVYRKDEKMWKWQNVIPELIVDDSGSKLHGFIVGGDAESFNRRSTYRLSMDRVMTMKYLVQDQENFDNKLVYNKTPELVIDDAIRLLGGERFHWVDCKCFLKDLSEGGAAIQSDEKLKKGDEITFEIPSEVGMVVCKAVVVRSRRETNGYYDFSYGCSFIETSRNFTRFFYETQRRQLQRMRDSEKNKKEM